MSPGRDPFTYEPRGSGSIFAGPNLPFTVAIVVALVALVAFLLLVRPFSADPAAAPPPQPTEPLTPIGEDTTTTTAPDLPPLQGIRLELLTDEIAQPVGVFSFPGSDRVFILERFGRVWTIDAAGGAPRLFMDLRDRVGSGGIENGLLGMAFHPEYATSGRFYLYYTTSPGLHSQVSEFRSAGALAGTADPATERHIIFVEQAITDEPGRHRAGMLQFGPDGYLYIALGDGGMGDRAAQELDRHQGSILRIDVDGDDPYAVPPDNPFVAGGGLPEIWAYGLRNPWRFAIDPVDGLIYIADVGQSDKEEINISPLGAGGLDYGWPNFEGTNCYQPPDRDCSIDPGERPVLQYSHQEGACSVTGGYVYRGAAMPELVGHYFYSDWCAGFIRSFRYQNGQVTQEVDWEFEVTDPDRIMVTAFGIDGDGELLVADWNGRVFRVAPVR